MTHTVDSVRMTTPYRNHAVSPVIKLKIRLLQMDVLKSDRVYFRYTIKNGDKSALYVNKETAFTYMLSHCKPNYENYYKGKTFVLETTKVVEYKNSNRFRNLRGL